MTSDELKLFKLTLTLAGKQELKNFERFEDFVIYASSEEVARDLANKQDPNKIWDDKKLTNCDEIKLIPGILFYKFIKL